MLEWLCHRHLTDGELAAALDLPPTNFSRRKEADDFPTFEELEELGAHFGVSSRALQIAFGLRGLDELGLLDEEGMRQYVEQGGGAVPTFVSVPKVSEFRPSHTEVANTRRRRVKGAPPGP